MKKMKKIELKDLFDEEQLEDILILLNNNDLKGLRKYLNYYKDELLKKGIIADYLYYVLVNEINKLK